MISGTSQKFCPGTKMKTMKKDLKWQTTDSFLLCQSCAPLERTFCAKIIWFSENLSKFKPFRWNFWKSRMGDISQIDPKYPGTTWKILKMSTLTLKMFLFFCLMVNFFTFHQLITYLGLPGYVTKILSRDESTIVSCQNRNKVSTTEMQSRLRS